MYQNVCRGQINRIAHDIGRHVVASVKADDIKMRSLERQNNSVVLTVREKGTSDRKLTNVMQILAEIRGLSQNPHVAKIDFADLTFSQQVALAMHTDVLV